MCTNMILLIICGRCMIISLFCICIPSHLRVLTKLSIVYEYEHYEHLDMITKEVKQCREVSPHRFECISTLNKESIDRYRPSGTAKLSHGKVSHVVEKRHAVNSFIRWYRTPGKKGSRRYRGSGQPFPITLLVKVTSEYPVVGRIKLKIG